MFLFISFNFFIFILPTQKKTEALLQTTAQDKSATPALSPSLLEPLREEVRSQYY